MDLEKVRIKAESTEGNTNGKVIFLRIKNFPAPTTSPISSNSELIDFNAAETNRYAYA